MRKRNHTNNRFHFFNLFCNSYYKIKSDEEKRQKTVRFGVLAIILSCLCVGLCYPCVWLGIQGIIYAFTHSFGIFTYILGLANIVIGGASAAFMFLPFYFGLQGIELVIMQFFLNKRFIRWIALLVWLVSVVGLFLLTLESILVITGAGHVFQ